MSSEHEYQLGHGLRSSGLVLANWMEHVSRVYDEWTHLPRQVEKFLEYRVADKTSARWPNFPAFFSDSLLFQSEMTRKVQWKWSGYAIKFKSREAEKQLRSDLPKGIDCPMLQHSGRWCPPLGREQI